MSTDQCNEKQPISQCFKDDVSYGKKPITSYFLRMGEKNKHEKPNQTNTKKPPTSQPNPTQISK